MPTLTFTILGCGSSGGVPRIGGLWGDCDPSNPKNHRRRCSMLVEQSGPNGITRVLIDTSPDLRSQLLDAGVGDLDAVVYTHQHADHVHGLDDLRMIVINRRAQLKVFADLPTQKALMERFGYAFLQPEGSPYPAILDMQQIDGPVHVSGAGGEIVLKPFKVAHGNIDALGFRIADLAYLPDVAEIYPDSWPMLEGLKCWVIDALRRAPHPTHTHLSQSLDWIEAVNPDRAVLTNMHVDLDYATVCDETPERVTAAFDGMRISFEI